MLKVIIKGQIERQEFFSPFRETVDCLESAGFAVDVNPLAAPLINGEKLGGGDFYIFFQSYPNEFSKTEINLFRAINPFAPHFFILGVCCEGMLRTAAPLDSPFYAYAHQDWSNYPKEIVRFLKDEPSLFSLPPTAEQDEIALWQNPIAENPPKNGEKILILTHFGPFGNDPAMNQYLADKWIRLGYETFFSGKELPKAFDGCILADADDSPPEKILKAIQSLRCRFADNDFTVYINSPRINEKTDYCRAGVTRVSAK